MLVSKLQKINIILGKYNYKTVKTNFKEQNKNRLTFTF